MPKRKRRTPKRPRPAPKPVGGAPLPAETGWRLAFLLARARGERLDEAEARLRRGGNTFEIAIDGQVITDADQAAALVQAAAAEYAAAFRRQQRRDPSTKELHAAVSKRCIHTKGRHDGEPVAESWFRRMLKHR